MGGSRDLLEGGHLFRFELTRSRPQRRRRPTAAGRRGGGQPRTSGTGTESESLLFGRNFGTATDIQTGPDGHLYVVSLSKGTIYEIERASR